MSKAIIVNCNCQSEFQDREHGTNRRVANVQDKTRDKMTGRADANCTVCGKTHK